MLDLIRDEIKERVPSEIHRFDSDMKGISGTVAYQFAMKWLQANLTQDAVNGVIARAVRLARRPTAPAEFDEDGLAEDWYFPKGTRELAELVARGSPQFRGPILTTNFDPLLPLAIENAGRRVNVRVLDSDGNVGRRVENRSGIVDVVYLHGYWRDSDTLHTPVQLTASRPRLKASLRNILKERTLVVAAYGAWDDVFTSTLAELLDDDDAQLNVLWCFFEKDAGVVASKYSTLLESVSRAIARGRFLAYGEIDCHSVFGEFRRLRASSNLPKVSGDALAAIRNAIDVAAEPLPRTVGATAASGHRQSSPIRLLEGDRIRRGDLFARLVSDLFIALGYEPPRINIAKSGDIDLWAEHRIEARQALAECRSVRAVTAVELNKFIGVLDSEARRGHRNVTGYFVSLSGFQGVDPVRRASGRLILMDGGQLVSELVRGRILIPVERATEVAGRYCAGHDKLVLDPTAELLAHDRGWIWAVHYMQNAVRTHYMLVHSDGTPLSWPLCREIVSADRHCGGELHSLTCLNPVDSAEHDAESDLAKALAAYEEYVVGVCSHVPLSGLPADTDVSARGLRLENLFVPQHLDVAGWKQREPVGAVLRWHPRIVVLAPAGSGKSTLVSRLALAYVGSRQDRLFDNTLPRREWFPLLVRCRDLRRLERTSFSDLVDELLQVDPLRSYAGALRNYLDDALAHGRIMLLIDGLDEISDRRDRDAFVRILRTCIEAYPNTALVLTSRESGFRHIATYLAPICTRTTFSPLSENEIHEFCVAWYREVVGFTNGSVAAEELAREIVENERLREFATNPLMLTTLLLIKRWVGTLPARRVVLYHKAVEVLLMTWNVESHAPIPEDEALPQLCYVAATMMMIGVHKISRRELCALLTEAREALPVELGYLHGTVDDFIDRVEHRSGLMLMTGYDVHDGSVQEMFGFCHLTFQEYLTAYALVEGWYRGHKQKDKLIDILRPYAEKSEWHEVLLLTSNLVRRDVAAQIHELLGPTVPVDG
jgi:hypothetical protein